MNQHKQYRFVFYCHELDSAHNKVHKKHQVHQVRHGIQVIGEANVPVSLDICCSPGYNGLVR